MEISETEKEVRIARIVAWAIAAPIIAIVLTFGSCTIRGNELDAQYKQTQTTTMHQVVERTCTDTLAWEPLDAKR